MYFHDFKIVVRGTGSQNKGGKTTLALEKLIKINYEMAVVNVGRWVMFCMRNTDWDQGSI